MKNFIFLIPILPFLGFLINGLARKVLPKTAISIIGCGTVLGAFLISLMIFIQSDYSATPFHYFNFISVGELVIPFAFQIDQLSTLFLLIITGVGFLIHVYSTAYMHGETQEHFGRYFSYLNLFIFSMLLLVMGANYVIMFIGWEGVGLCSYLLIGYWFKNVDYTKAAKKAFVMNRIGDLGFLLAIFWIISKAGSVDYNVSFHLRILPVLHSYYLLGPLVKVRKYLCSPGCPMLWPAPLLYQHLYMPLPWLLQEFI
jgi:NADH-quinone oxidoreductase subunit L